MIYVNLGRHDGTPETSNCDLSETMPVEKQVVDTRLLYGLYNIFYHADLIDGVLCLVLIIICAGEEQ